MHWQSQPQIHQALEKTFNDILHGRMQDMPLLNQALKVQALGFTQTGDDWIGVLLTPWCMNLLLLPSAQSDWCELPAGSQFQRQFPYGGFSFTVAHEAQLGCYGQCSLFSPMLQFADQRAAETAGQSALQALLAPPAAPALSRRDLLRLHLGRQ